MSPLLERKRIWRYHPIILFFSLFAKWTRAGRGGAGREDSSRIESLPSNSFHTSQNPLLRNNIKHTHVLCMCESVLRFLRTKKTHVYLLSFSMPPSLTFSVLFF